MIGMLIHPIREWFRTTAVTCKYALENFLTCQIIHNPNTFQTSLTPSCHDFTSFSKSNSVSARSNALTDMSMRVDKGTTSSNQTFDATKALCDSVTTFTTPSSPAHPSYTKRLTTKPYNGTKTQSCNNDLVPPVSTCPSRDISLHLYMHKSNA